MDSNHDMMHIKAKGAALRRLVTIIVLAGLLVLGYAYSGRAVEEMSYAVAAGESRAARERLSGQDATSELFRRVAKAVKPAVAVVHVKKRLKVTPSPYPEMEEFLKPFFRKRPMPPLGSLVELRRGVARPAAAVADGILRYRSERRI